MVRKNRASDFLAVNRGAIPMRRRYASAYSVDRYSEHSLHDDYIEDYSDSFCNDFLARVPYATLIATIMCYLGIGIFCGTMYRAGTLTTLMTDQVLHIRLEWIHVIQIIFAVIGASMAALGFMILCLGCLTTGATRQKVYRAWRSRVGGRITCAFFMTLIYILQITWLVIFAFLVIATFVFTTFWGLCSNPRVQKLEQCIDFSQFSFMFPDYTRPEDMQICGSQEVKLFCKDYVEKTEFLIILATIASFLILLSLVHYLMCLAANYAHIRDHEKFQELQELQCLQDPGGDLDSPTLRHGTLSSHHRSKDRF